MRESQVEAGVDSEQFLSDVGAVEILAIRTGSSNDIKTHRWAFAYGFDYVAVAAGAGKPTVLELPNGLATGVRTASDFLMALHSPARPRANSVANMQLRLPVVVVGGGLTAIDTAPRRSRTTRCRWRSSAHATKYSARRRERDAVESGWSEVERSIAEEFLAHARAIRASGLPPLGEGRAARIVELLQAMGRGHHRLSPAPRSTARPTR